MQYLDFKNIYMLIFTNLFFYIFEDNFCCMLGIILLNCGNKFYFIRCIFLPNHYFSISKTFTEAFFWKKILTLYNDGNRSPSWRMNSTMDKSLLFFIFPYYHGIKNLNVQKSSRINAEFFVVYKGEQMFTRCIIGNELMLKRSFSFTLKHKFDASLLA